MIGLHEMPTSTVLATKGGNVARPRTGVAENAPGRGHRGRALKIVDLRDGVVTYDENQALKEPDWTYREA